MVIGATQAQRRRLRRERGEDGEEVGAGDGDAEADRNRLALVRLPYAQVTLETLVNLLLRLRQISVGAGGEDQEIGRKSYTFVRLCWNDC